MGDFNAHLAGYPPYSTSGKSMKLQTFIDSMRLICQDPCGYTYFTSETRTKVDYFFFD